jgi:lysophospholipase L1-like esterase
MGIKTLLKLFFLIPLYSIFKNENGFKNNELLTDGIHLNEKGYQKWIDYIKPIVFSYRLTLFYL